MAWPEFEQAATDILMVLTSWTRPTLALAVARLADAADELRPVSTAVDVSELTTQEYEALRAQFVNGDGCLHCGGSHLRACPRVKRLAFHGTEVAEVEYWRHGEWPTDDIFFPEQFPPLGGKDAEGGG